MLEIRLVLFFLLFIPYVISKTSSSREFDHSDEHLISKRQINGLPLVFPYGATYKLQIGITSPVSMKDAPNLIYIANFQYQYLHFQNITQLSQYYFIKEVSREEREADFKHRREERLIFYKSFANMLEAQGMNGFECVLRAICEAAQYPVEDQGIVGELFHILLTPDYGKTSFDDVDPEWEESMSEFKDAATAGRQMFSCPAIYSDCPEGQGVMELISTLKD